MGGPNWQQLFKYLLQQCRHIQHYEAVYLLVDTRDLTVVDNVEPSLAHWPAVAAWWSSRLRYVGPREEQVDLVFVRATRSSGLHLVHPTWAGTFVLAALVFLFPKTHFILLDSDCVPVALFEVEELWALTSEPLSCQAPAPGSGTDGPAHKARKTRQDEEEQVKEPRVILVTEPHTDINAGFVVIFGSQHSAPLDMESIDQQCSQIKDSDLAEWWEEVATTAYKKYRALTLEYLCNYSDPTFLSSEEQGQVLQSGLALSPIAWARTRHTVDWAITWALVGEWASRELFPPPTRGEWPKHGHDDKLSNHFKNRRPGLVGWARAAFEQGALPALVMLPGLVETRVLPGDSVFQATHIIPGYMRPAVVHGYGGAKVDLPTSLPALSAMGWTTLGASLVGTIGSLPQSCKKESGDSVRLAPGCGVSFKVTPAPLTLREESCLMALRRPLSPDEVEHPSPAREWLARCDPQHSQSRTVIPPLPRTRQ